MRRLLYFSPTKQSGSFCSERHYPVSEADQARRAKHCARYPASTFERYRQFRVKILHYLTHLRILYQTPQPPALETNKVPENVSGAREGSTGHRFFRTMPDFLRSSEAGRGPREFV